MWHFPLSQLQKSMLTTPYENPGWPNFCSTAKSHESITSITKGFIFSTQIISPKHLIFQVKEWMDAESLQIFLSSFELY